MNAIAPDLVMPLSEAKNIMRECLSRDWNDRYAYAKTIPALAQTEPGYYDFSPLKNKFTSYKQVREIEQMQVGDKNTLYLCTVGDGKGFKAWGQPRKVESWVVTTWTGKRVGKITNMSFFEGSGFAPAKRVSITFQFKGMTFRGICSYENMQCFTIKRVK